MGDGQIILVDKPYGWRATQAVRWVKRHYRCRRAGHAGTLDPLATGLLLIATNDKTQQIEHLMNLPKVYYALVRLGYQTPSDDAEFPPQRVAPPPRLSTEDWEVVLSEFRGSIWQRPPAYAAIKVQGQRAYALARAGQAPALTARPVVAYELRLLRYDPPELALLYIRAGRGFYVRSLARDIGERLGCGAYLAALRRTEIGPYTVHQALQPDASALR
jgi:tRNA pseudouridine55 synthase